MDFASKTVVELRKIAKEHNVRLPSGINKSDIIQRLEEALALRKKKQLQPLRLRKRMTRKTGMTRNLTRASKAQNPLRRSSPARSRIFLPSRSFLPYPPFLLFLLLLPRRLRRIRFHPRAHRLLPKAASLTIGLPGTMHSPRRRTSLPLLHVSNPAPGIPLRHVLKLSSPVPRSVRRLPVSVPVLVRRVQADSDPSRALDSVHSKAAALDLRVPDSALRMPLKMKKRRTL